MGKWMKTFRKYRHLDLVFGLIMLIIAIWVISATWGKITGLSPEDYVSAEVLLPLPELFTYIFFLGLIAGSSLTTYVILELTKD